MKARVLVTWSPLGFCLDISSLYYTWYLNRIDASFRRQQLRLKRLSESPDKNHTFKPQLIARNESASSKLPVGARAGGAAALP